MDSASLLPGGGYPVRAHEVTGDFAALFRDRPQARDLIERLASREGQQKWADDADVFSANRRVRSEGGPVEQAIARRLTGPGTLCLDASDVMPPAVRDAFYEAVLLTIARAAAGEDLDLPGLLNDVQKVADAQGDRPKAPADGVRYVVRGCRSGWRGRCGGRCPGDAEGAVEVAAEGGGGAHAGAGGDRVDAVGGGFQEFLGAADALGQEPLQGVVPVAAWKWRVRVRELILARRARSSTVRGWSRRSSTQGNSSVRGWSFRVGTGAGTNWAWPPERCGGTTRRRATVLAAAEPWSRRTRCRQRSIAAALPAEVSTLPLST